MPKYLRTSAISAVLEELIREARERLYIICPYIKLSDSIRELLKDKDREKTNIIIIYGKKQELGGTEMDYLLSLKYVNLYFSKNLHAKCYLNENKMIISSMNLYEFSQQNNKEMGILVEKKIDADRQTYEEAWKDIESILINSEHITSIEPAKGPQTSSTEQTTLKVESRKSNSVRMGYCIRTGIQIPFNIEKPMSNEGFKAWNKYSDVDYPEKFCHFSGENSNKETSMSKPILQKNWKKAKEIFNL